MFSRTDLLGGGVGVGAGRGDGRRGGARARARLVNEGTLHAANHPVPGESLTTDKAVADEKESDRVDEAMARAGAKTPMRARRVDKLLRNGPLTEGQKAAVKLILSEKDRVVGVQGYAGTGKTRMLNRARALLEKQGYEIKGLAPFCLGRADARGRSEHRNRDAAAIPVEKRRRRPRPAHEERRESDARGGSGARSSSSTRARSPPPCRRGTCFASPGKSGCRR